MAFSGWLHAQAPDQGAKPAPHADFSDVAEL